MDILLSNMILKYFVLLANTCAGRHGERVVVGTQEEVVCDNTTSLSNGLGAARRLCTGKGHWVPKDACQGQWQRDIYI